MNPDRTKPAMIALRAGPLVLMVAALVAFGAREPKFLEVANLENILVQSSSIAIVATGMTFVLVAAGIDLSVGSAMFLAAIVAGKLALAGYPMILVLAVVPAVGLTCGAVNGLVIARFHLLPFIATLGTLSVGRGLGLYLTQTRAMNLPDAFLRIGSARLLGLPAPVAIMLVAAIAGQGVLSFTPLGRQIYAVGHDPVAARKAGVDVPSVLLSAYLASGLCAAIGGLVLVAQLAAVSPTLGERWEFDAIAAAVLGGTSLYGGRGRVLPGTLLGAILIQAIRNGLNLVNANPYMYPVVVGAVVFLAVLPDGARHARLRALGRRTIRH